MTMIKVDDEQIPIPDHPAIDKYRYVTEGYIRELAHENPLTRANKLAGSYQDAVEKYTNLDQDKVKLWKAIRARLEKAYSNRAERGSIEAFKPSTVRDELGVEPPDEYHAQIEDLSDQYSYDPKRWWYQCGYHLENLEHGILKEHYPDQVGDEGESDADDGEESDDDGESDDGEGKGLTIDEWDPSSKFVQFGQKVMKLEASIQVFARELRQYVLYGGGKVFGVDGGDRDYEWIRDELGKDVFTGQVDLKKPKAMVTAPPPSPFLAKFMRIGDFASQVNRVDTLTKKLDKTEEGRLFLKIATEDENPWALDRDVEDPQQFYLVNRDTPTATIEDNQHRKPMVEAVEALVGRHMGFNLLAFLDDPDRTGSRSAKPGTQQPMMYGSQFRWYRWTDTNEFKAERPGTIFRYESKQTDEDRCPFLPMSWELRGNSKGKIVASIATRALKGVGKTLGDNCEVTADEPPSSDFSATELNSRQVRMNVATAAGIGIKLTPLTSTAQAAYTGQDNIVQYFEHMVDQDSPVSSELRSWKKNSQSLQAMPLMTGIYAGVFSLLKVGETIASSDDMHLKDYNTIGSAVLETTAILEDFTDDQLKRKLANLSSDVTNKMVGIAFEVIGFAAELIDAIYSAREAAYLAAKGQEGKAWMVGSAAGIGLIGGLTGALAGLAQTGVIAGVSVPGLLIVSAVCAMLSAVITIFTITFFEVWSELETWVKHCTFGDSYGQLTGQNERYYGFVGDHARQYSILQGEQYVDSVDRSYVALEEEDHPFRLVVSGLVGASDESDLLICAQPDENDLPNHRHQLYPLMYFDLGWDGADLRTTEMPTGFKFGTMDTYKIETFEVRDDPDGPGKQFELDCSKGQLADPVELFGDHFLSPPARDAWSEKQEIQDWGWEVLYFPSGMPEKQRAKLKEVDNTDSDTRPFHELLFSLTVPRLRLQMASQATGVLAFDNMWLTGNR